MNSKVLTHIYIAAGLAFIFALGKYIFLEGGLNAQFFIIEIISYLLFLFLVYKCDQNTRHYNQERIQKSELFDCEKEKLITEIKELKDRIEEYEIEKNRHKHSENIADSLIAKLTEDLDGITDKEQVANKLLQCLSSNFEIGIGLCYFKSEPSGKYTVEGSYAINEDFELPSFEDNEGIHAQAVKDKDVIVISELDENYIDIESASGSAKPNYVYLLPIVKDDDCVGLLELASFKRIMFEEFWMGVNEFLVKNKAF